MIIICLNPCYLQVGVYSGGALNIPLEETLRLKYVNIPAKCVGECAQCAVDSMGNEKFIYVNGEIHIAGMQL